MEIKLITAEAECRDYPSLPFLPNDARDKVGRCNQLVASGASLLPSPNHAGQTNSAVALVEMAEIAGLVLAVVPLLISALEHYEDAIAPSVAFLRWRQQLPKVIRDLYMGHTSYEQNIRLLLDQSTSKEQLSEMVSDPNCVHWKSEDLVDALQDRLGTAYEPCMSTINEIAGIMTDIAKCLNIEGADKVSKPIYTYRGESNGHLDRLRRKVLRFSFSQTRLLQMQQASEQGFALRSGLTSQ